MKQKRTLATIIGLALIIGIAAIVAMFRTPPATTDQPRGGSTMLVPAAPGRTPSRVDYHRLDERFRAIMQQPEMVGLAVGTIENGQIRFVRGYGEALAGSGIKVTPDTVFRWASVSKGVASAVVTRLAEQHRLSLAAPVSSFGTTLTLPGGTQNVNVADVLSHRLGLVRNAWDERLEAGEDPRALRAQLGTLAPYCPPATCYSYQNIAFDTASEIVEHVTGQRYAQVAHDMIFAPLGMRHTTIGRAGLEGAASWARPHRYARHAVSVNDNYYRVPAAGGVNSSIRDLLRWMSAQMGDAPRVLSPIVLDVMHRPRVPTPPHSRLGAMDRALKNASYGLAWRNFDYMGHHLVGHRGAVDGYGSLVMFDPAEKSGIVMLWNSNRGTAARMQLEFFDMLYGLPRTDWVGLDTNHAEPD